MATAIINGMIRSKAYAAKDIGIFDIAKERQEMHAKQGVTVYCDIPSLVAASKFVVLSVKPQVVNSVLPQIRETFTPDKVIISIAAGISSNHIKKTLGENAKVVIVMPNTPLMLGKGATAVSHGASVTDEEFLEARGIFESSGITAEVAEEKIPETIAIQGSTPAVIYLLAKEVVGFAQQKGIAPEVSLPLFCQTLVGAAEMLMKTDLSPDELVRMVCSPGGTTLAGIASLEKDGFSKALQNAEEAFVRRAYEMRAELEK